MPDETPPAEVTKIRFRCPGCRRRFTASVAHIGRSSACPKCKTRVVVPAQTEVAADETDFSDMVGVDCRLCKTRMYVRPRYIGKRVQCPDCDTLTVVQAPKPKVKPLPPAAMEGRQYEVYEGEEQPWAADLIAAEPKYIDVVCMVCQTLMRAEESAVGSSLTCPDCLTKTVVERPKKKRKKKASPEIEAGYAVEKIEPVTSTLQTDLYAEALKRPPLGYRPTTGEGGKPTGRPDPPRFGMFSGVMRFWGASITLAWMGLSAGLLVAMGSPLSMSILAPFIAVLIWLGVASMIFTELVVASSEGSDELNHWPSLDMGEWIGPAMTLVFAGVVTMIPGSLANHFMPMGPDGLWFELGAWLTLPWILLSQLEGGAIWCVFSPRLLRTLRWAPGSWLIFYIETALLFLGLGILAVILIWQVGWWGLFLTPPATVFAFLMYARLLGRLAWIIAVATPDRETED